MKTTNSTIRVQSSKPTSPLTATGPKRITKPKPVSKKSRKTDERIWQVGRIGNTRILSVDPDLLTWAEAKATVAGSTLEIVPASEVAAQTKPPKLEGLGYRASYRLYQFRRDLQEKRWEGHKHSHPLLGANRRVEVFVTLTNDGTVMGIFTDELYAGRHSELSNTFTCYRGVLTVEAEPTFPRPSHPEIPRQP